MSFRDPKPESLETRAVPVEGDRERLLDELADFVERAVDGGISRSTGSAILSRIDRIRGAGVSLTGSGLREALTKYVRHHFDCEWLTYDPIRKGPGDCTCGLAAALSGESGEPKHRGTLSATYVANDVLRQENERLRQALTTISAGSHPGGHRGAVIVARSALDPEADWPGLEEHLP